MFCDLQRQGLYRPFHHMGVFEGGDSPSWINVVSAMDETILLGLGVTTDPQTQQRAVQYFEQLKASESGWQHCATALTNGAYQQNDHIKFFCFQVIEDYLKTRYEDVGVEEQQILKSFLLTWLQQHCQDATKNRSFICNKAAQLFTLTFLVDYPERWPGFFTDLLKSLSLGEAAIDLYLRVLTAIDSEVVDRDIAHTTQEVERNTRLKDQVRIQCVNDLVDSWFHICTRYETSNPEVTCFCLSVIGAYISWIDIGLIANDRFVPVLLKFMGMPLLRESACDCIHEIINKGMEPLAKVKLIESFSTMLERAGLLRIDNDDDGDYLAKLAKLVNGMTIELIAAFHKLMKAKEEENAKLPAEAIETKVPLVMELLGNEDDDVSGAVAMAAHDYLSLLKQVPQLTEVQKQHIKEMLCVVITKMKYDDSYCFDQEGEDEAMFEEYRKELKVIINTVGSLDSDLLMLTTKELLTRNLTNWQSVKFQDVEVAIAMLYQLGEALPGSLSQQFSTDSEKTTGMVELLRLLVTSNVSCYQHSSVAMQFFETVGRYDKFFNTLPEYIPDVLMAFLDERGLRNPSSHVSSRTAYLFSRFVKTISKGHLHGYLEEILSRIHALLVLNSPDNGTKHYLSSDDQLFMYETAGVLVVQSQFPPEKKQVLMKQLLAPIVSKFDVLLQSMVSETDENRQLAYAQCLTQAMAFTSRTSKGFSSQQTVKQCGCTEAFTETLTIFLRALDTPVHRQMLHQGVRQFLHRMVVCLEQEVLPFIPVAMESLLKNPDAKELHDFIPLINQVVSKFKKEIVPFLQQVFMGIVTTIFRVLNDPADERDQVVLTEKKFLKRGYFSFLVTLVNNNVTEVLSNQEPENLQQVLLTVIEGAVELADPQSQKMCFVVLRKLVESWAGDTDGLAGFTDFVYKNILPACFMAPLKPSFDLSDAQTVLALNECANCLKTMLEKRGDEFLNYLLQEYFPSENVSPDIAQELCTALKSDAKVFRTYLKSFFVRAKS